MFRIDLNPRESQQKLYKSLQFLFFMAKSSLRPKRKYTSGRYKPHTKKLSNLSSSPILTKLGEKRTRIERKRSGNKKIKLLSHNLANIYDPKTKKTTVTEIKNIINNDANRHFIRRKILTKGAIIDTKLGKARVTSRPGQESTINAILI